MEQQAELQAQLAQQKNVLAEAEGVLQQAKLDALAIAEKATAELRGEGTGGSFSQSRVVQAFRSHHKGHAWPSSTLDGRSPLHAPSFVRLDLAR